VISTLDPCPECLRNFRLREVKVLPYFAGRKQGVGYLAFRSPSHAMKKPARWQRAVAAATAPTEEKVLW